MLDDPSHEQPLAPIKQMFAIITQLIVEMSLD